MTDQPAGGAAPAPDKGALRFQHSGKFGELLPIALLNFVLTVVTLGIYRFWARTRVRKYLWSKTTLMGDALEYTGRGSELFIGFLLSILTFIVPLIIVNFGIQIIFGEMSPLLLVYIAFVYFFLIWLFGYAIYSAQRYRLSRTSWRGIRAGLGGTRSEYAWKFLGYGLLTALTLGLTTPVRDVALYRHLMNDAWFGDKRFSYSGTSGRVYGPFLLSLVLFVVAAIVYAMLAAGLMTPFTEVMKEVQEGGEFDPQKFMIAYLFLLLYVIGLMFVLVLIFSIYQAYLVNHFVRELKLDGATFSLSPQANPQSFAWLVFGNILIVTLTLGIGLPFAQMRMFAYIANRLQVEGIDVHSIGQNELPPPKYGEGLAELFDAGTI